LDGDLLAWRLKAELPHDPERAYRLFAAREPPPRRDRAASSRGNLPPVPGADEDVLPDREPKQEALGSAVFANEPDPVLDRLTRRLHRDFSPGESQRPTERISPGKAAQQLPLALALQAADAKDLPSSKSDVDRSTSAGQMDVVQLKQRLPRDRWKRSRLLLLQPSSQHGLNELGLSDLVLPGVEHVSAVAQDHDLIGDLVDLSQPVRDEEHRAPLGGKRLKTFE